MTTAFIHSAKRVQGPFTNSLNTYVVDLLGIFPMMHMGPLIGKLIIYFASVVEMGKSTHRR